MRNWNRILLMFILLVVIMTSVLSQPIQLENNQIKLSTPKLDSLFIAYHQDILSRQERITLPYFLLADIYEGAEGVLRVQLSFEYNINLEKGVVISFFKLDDISCLIRTTSLKGIVGGYPDLLKSFFKENLPNQYQVNFGEPEMLIFDGDTLFGKTETIVLGKRYVWDIIFRGGIVVDVRKRLR